MSESCAVGYNMEGRVVNFMTTVPRVAHIS